MTIKYKKLNLNQELQYEQLHPSAKKKIVLGFIYSQTHNKLFPHNQKTII